MEETNDDRLIEARGWRTMRSEARRVSSPFGEPQSVIDAMSHPSARRPKERSPRPSPWRMTSERREAGNVVIRVLVEQGRAAVENRDSQNALILPTRSTWNPCTE